MPDIYESYLKLPNEIFLPKTGSSSVGSQKIQNIDISEEGIRTSLEGDPYPMKGYPHPLHVRAVGVVKKIMLSAFRVLAAHPYLAVLLWPARKRILLEFSRFSDRVLRDYYFKPEYYIKSGQEIYRAGMTNYNALNHEVTYNIVMLMVMLWEYEDTYRYRGQFVLSNLNKEALRENPRKELKRLCDILITHEKEPTMSDKWRSVKRTLSFLPIQPFVDFLLDLDLEKIAMDKADRYFADKKGDFIYA